MKKRISAMLLVLVLMFAMSMNVMATGTGTGAELVVTASEIDDAGQLVVSVGIQNGEGVTNGHITVNYDSELVELVSVTKGNDCRFSSVNDKTKGKVSLAWVGNAFSADETQLLELTLKVNDEARGTARFTASAVKVYANGSALDVKDGAASVEVGKAEEPTNPKDPDNCPFVDIDNHWAREEIGKVWAEGLFNGMTETNFQPDGEMTRAMFVTTLYRASGEPEVKGESGFADVKGTAYYADAVTWAVDGGITNGTSETTFSPDNTLTRQEMVTMLCRYAKNNGDDVKGRAALTGFVDSAEIASWAKDSVSWAVKEGIINGYEDDTLRPNANTTRAQVAAVLCRYLGL